MNTEEMLSKALQVAEDNNTVIGELVDMIKPTPTEQKQIDAVADYVADFIAKRFPEGLPAQLHGIIAEIVLDAFHDGARYNAATEKEESRIITEL